MSRLDLYRLAGMEGYVMEVQANLMSMLATTVVAPLLPEDMAPRPMTRLNPIFEIAGPKLVLITHSLAAVLRKELGPPVGSIAGAHEYEVTNALDMLLSNA